MVSAMLLCYMTSFGKCRPTAGLLNGVRHLPCFMSSCYTVELDRYRFFGRFFQKSVSVSVSVFQNIAISVSVFGFSARTYRCLSINTIADTLRPPLSLNGVWALEFALQIAAIRDSDIFTIYNYRNTPSLYRTVLSSTRCALPFSQNGEWGPKNLHCDLRPNSNS